MCECKFHNGNPIQACRPLCQSGESPKCEPNSQTIEEYQDPVNGTSCMCTKKKMCFRYDIVSNLLLSNGICHSPRCFNKREMAYCVASLVLFSVPHSLLKF